MNKFFVIANESSKGSWVDVVWSDIKNQATIFLDNNTLKNSMLKKIKKLHFSNRINKTIWIPFKSIWDRDLVIKIDDLRSEDKNILIFQSNIKFSPKFIKKLKNSKNVIIVLYLPDTIKGIGIGDSYKEFKRYAQYYQIDYVYSFDPMECQKYGFAFFDIYSKMDIKNQHIQNDIFYIGNCRSPERYHTLLSLYEKLHGYLKCNFNLIGVDKNNQKYKNDISYNHPMDYSTVVENVCKTDTILEIVNSGQTGNTFRFKEAVCYNKKLLTNNPQVLYDKYYNSNFVFFFKNIEDVEEEWFDQRKICEYGYCGEYSPRNLLNMITEEVDKG